MLQILTNGGSRIFLPKLYSWLVFAAVRSYSFHMLQNAMDVCIRQEMTDKWRRLACRFSARFCLFVVLFVVFNILLATTAIKIKTEIQSH